MAAVEGTKADYRAYEIFLKRLRSSGRQNMYGAIPYLVTRFGITREHAFSVVCRWLDQQAEDAA